MNLILLALAPYQHVRAWKNATGVARSPDGERVISFGLKGSADILGIVGPCGRFLAIEAKTGGAKQSADQKSFENMILARGGFYFVARSVEEAVRFVGSILT